MKSLQSRSMSTDFDRPWWEQTWAEREDAIWKAFGESQTAGEPAGYVTSIAFSDLPLPGACIYTFPPNEGDEAAGRERRPHWLYMTHGLAQWLTRAEANKARESGNRASGTGYEFGMMCDAPSPGSQASCNGSWSTF